MKTKNNPNIWAIELFQKLNEQVEKVDTLEEAKDLVRAALQARLDRQKELEAIWKKDNIK